MPRRRRNSSAISFFSFQDIIMSVVGTVILLMLFLILKLITQTVVAEPVSMPEITEAELVERVLLLEETRREIQDEITRLNQTFHTETLHIPSLDQIDAIRTSVERLEGDVQKMEEEIKTAKEHHAVMTNRPDARLVLEMEERIRLLEQLRDELKQRTADLTKQQQSLQAKRDDLTKQQTDLDRQLTTDVVRRVYAIPSKATDKTPWLLIYGQGTITALSQANPKGQSFSSRQAFFTWAATRNVKTEYLVLYVRPSRFEEYESVLDRLKQMGFDVGLQVLGEKTEIFLQ
jgi:hypothetical protein